MTTTATTTAQGTDDLAARVQRLEDRAAISELVITYARSIDRNDWQALGAHLTDPVHVDFSEAGLPASDFPRDAFAGFSGSALSGFDALQHLSPNHVITFDESDPDRALCTSSMFAQHHLEGAEGGDTYVMRGWYENHVVRARDGWKIEKLVQHLSWPEGNADLPAQAAARFAAAHPQGGATGAPSPGSDA